MKLGVHRDLAVLFAGELSEGEIGAALQAYVTNRKYQERLREGAIRVDLDGHPAGIVTADEAKSAAASLAARKAKRAVKQPPPAQPKLSGLAALRASARARREA